MTGAAAYRLPMVPMSLVAVLPLPMATALVPMPTALMFDVAPDDRAASDRADRVPDDVALADGDGLDIPADRVDGAGPHDLVLDPEAERLAE